LKGTIIAVCTSEKKGTRKTNVGAAQARINWGLVGDAHAGNWHRQISLLAMESIQKMRAAGLTVGPGDFAENLTVQGMGQMNDYPVGTHFRIGETELELTQIGKLCHAKCAIFELAGDCVMPREGVFVKVLKAGAIKVGDEVQVLEPPTA
jgi:MOSC domain-containing protein YiiM